MEHETSRTDTAGTALAVALVLGLASCSGYGEAAEIAGEGPQGGFPYLLADGAVVCGDGREQNRELEYYYFERINHDLGDDPALAAFAASRGVTSVNACEDARQFAELHRQYVERQSGNIVATSSSPDTAEGSEEGVVEEGIADGFVAGTNLNFVVRVSGCSAVLISPNWMLTAAHCFSVDGWVGNDVYLRTTRINDGNIWIARHPSWNGLVTSGYDIALVWSSGWLPPANTEGAWLRVFGRQLFEGSQIVITATARPITTPRRESGA